jgi:hypothetical protein
MWTKEQINFILANRNMPLKDMAEHLGKNLGMTSKNILELRVSDERNHR